MIKLINILKEIIEGTCGYTTDANTNKKLNTPGGLKESDPKTGTGKKPKGSGRRLYTDENPNDTVSIKFKTKEDIVDTLNKDSFKSKSHARKSQIINLIHQRVRAAYGKAKDSEVKARLKRALDYIEKRKESSKAKTQRLNKETADPQSGKAAPYGSGYAPVKNKKLEEDTLNEKCWPGYTKKGMKTMFGKKYPNCVKND
jgi:cell division protein FtsN